jgi:hypothetical protein
MPWVVRRVLYLPLLYGNEQRATSSWVGVVNPSRFLVAATHRLGTISFQVPVCPKARVHPVSSNSTPIAPCCGLDSIKKSSESIPSRSEKAKL